MTIMLQIGKKDKQAPSDLHNHIVLQNDIPDNWDLIYFCNSRKITLKPRNNDEKLGISYGNYNGSHNYSFNGPAHGPLANKKMGYIK